MKTYTPKGYLVVADSIATSLKPGDRVVERACAGTLLGFSSHGFAVIATADGREWLAHPEQLRRVG